MRDFRPPVNLICSQIPRHILEDQYSIMITKPLEGEDPERPPTADEFLSAYACNLTRKTNCFYFKCPISSRPF